MENAHNTNVRFMVDKIAVVSYNNIRTNVLIVALFWVLSFSVV